MRTPPGRRPRTIASAAIILIVTGVGVSPSHAAAWTAPQAATQTAPALSPDAQRVVDYLLEDWAKRFRSTSIPLAMANLEIPPNDALRLEVLAYFHEHTELANNLTWWGPNNYAFSNQEKLIAKYVIHMHERENRAPTTKEATEALGLDAAELGSRLGFMASAGFAQRSADPLGFGLAPGYKRWAGPLQHNFHTVTIEGERPFDVW